MPKLIIIDDEMLAVEGIKAAVDWGKLGITAVHTAFNMRQAMEVFSSQPIDIMLCDIEMPEGSGLELLTWVRRNYPKTESIFLTCHADFHYARQAIQLGSLDYLLKPVPANDLETVITRAIDRIERNNKLLEASRLGQFWSKHQHLVVERFWADVLNRTISSDPTNILKAAKERNIHFDEGMSFLPVMVTVRRWHAPLSPGDVHLMNFALKNIAEEVILSGDENGMIIGLDQGVLLCILTLSGDESGWAPILNRMGEKCESYIEACSRYFKCDLSCYIGNKAGVHELASIVDRLTALSRDNVAFDNRVFTLCAETARECVFNLPDMGVWSVMLLEGLKDKMLREVEAYMENLVKQAAINAQVLQQFHQDFLQMAYSVLKQRGIQAHQLFNDYISMELYANAARSVKDMLAWVRHIVTKGAEYSSAIRLSQPVIDRVLKYISLHLEQELTREDIAGHVFLHPDYLTRIFKRATGLSLPEYISQERLKLAGELLSKTDMPVSMIAAKVGFSNFSYFSKLFKKQFGMNPAEFKKNR